jgi:type IV pilus assembly protein PilC
MHSRDKARLYHELGQLLRAGFSLPRALEKLIALHRGQAATALQEAAAVLKNGGTSAEALSKPAAFAGLDSAIFAAGDKSGQLERCLALAGEYHETVAAAQSRILVKSAYPLFIVHFAILAFAVPKFVTEGADAFVWTLVANYGMLWACVVALWFGWRSLQTLAQRQAAVDRVLSSIPIFGGLRRKFALSRFCLAYDMQLEAGINVFSALERRALPPGLQLRAGRRAAQRRAFRHRHLSGELDPRLRCGGEHRPARR